MRSVFTFCAVLMAAVFATACVEGVDGVDELDDEELEQVEIELPTAHEPEVMTPPQELRRNDDPDEGGQINAARNDDPDEGGQIKRAANRARNTATR